MQAVTEKPINKAQLLQKQKCIS